ncbi:MAG: asparaginase domain-containing protein, partial [Pontixanthobacter sp.]
LVVMSDRLFAARDVRKAHTENVDAFKGFPRGPVGYVTPTSLEWFGPAWRMGEGARYDFFDDMPKVSILYAYSGMSADNVQQALDGGAKGIVLAGFGHGNAPRWIRDALAQAAARGVLVVRSSRVDEGLVDREPEDDAAGFIAARALGPARARILLQLLLANGITDPVRAQEEFSRR